MAVALLTTYPVDYRRPLYERLAERIGLEVLCYGGGERYAAPWFSDLDGLLAEACFPARRLEGGAREAFSLGRRYDAVIAPFAGGALLPAAFLGTRAVQRPFVLWASVWAQPRSLTHLFALPLTRRIYREAEAVVAYGEHVRRYVARIRGRDEDVLVAPQAVEADLFGRPVGTQEQAEFRRTHGLGDGPLVLYAGRLVREKGVDVLLEAWERLADEAPGATGSARATLVMIGDGPLKERVASSAAADPRVRLLGVLPRVDLPKAYATASATLLPSVATPRFREPWGLVCNEAMQQGCPPIVSTAVGAYAGGLVRDQENGLVVPAGDSDALAEAIRSLLGDPALVKRLGAAAREAVRPYTYDAMAEAFERALELARASQPAA